MSNIIENLKIRGDLNIQLFDEQGNLKESHDRTNLVVTAGLTYICSRMANTSQGAMGFMALGSGTTAAAAGQTDLTTLIGSRNALDSTTPGASSVVYVSTFGAGVSTGAVTEAGIFNASTAGTMLCRTVFPVVNKQSGDTMVVTWTISLTAS
ncbi:hypothetical protein [Polynucleobacter sp. UK-Kesae-W10]|uniref:hypothetical protein n=1 Tax=Polynucleobacter sp. UK-Kesae-W10 TaxID=1819738 RepID=UPI001C0AA671|nr:hypothetical protein [Polynucleobacter sp. UK-Kesae-W10]MBU3577582.1 hypothetical protein [Polynucleobacter sp. UK-Kesae-W10]